MILKIKAFIYRLTGIYLAYREECDYTETEEFWDKFDQIYFANDGSIAVKSVYGILIGSWQAEHGFVRSYKWK